MSCPHNLYSGVSGSGQVQCLDCGENLKAVRVDRKVVFEPVLNKDELKCEACGADRHDVTATLIGCPACGRIWGLVDGQWKEETNRQFKVLAGGARAVFDNPRVEDDKVVMDVLMELPMAVKFVRFDPTDEKSCQCVGTHLADCPWANL